MIIPQSPLFFISCCKYFVLLYSLISDLAELVKIFVTGPNRVFCNVFQVSVEFLEFFFPFCHGHINISVLTMHLAFMSSKHNES